MSFPRYSTLFLAVLTVLLLIVELNNIIELICVYSSGNDIWEIKNTTTDSQSICTENTDVSTTSTSQLHCQSLCEADENCVGIACDNYFGCTEKCVICYAGIFVYDPDYDFIAKPPTPPATTAAPLFDE